MAQKTSRVFMRFSKVTSVEVTNGKAGSVGLKPEWYCMEYPTFDEIMLRNPEKGIERAKAMIALHKVATRVFYIGMAPAREYIFLKTEDALFEALEPNRLKEMKGYLPEDLLKFLTEKK